MCVPSLSLMLVIMSDNSYKRNNKDEDYASEIDKKEISFDIIDNEDFLLLLKPASILSKHINNKGWGSCHYCMICTIKAWNPSRTWYNITDISVKAVLLRLGNLATHLIKHYCVLDRPRQESLQLSTIVRCTIKAWNPDRTYDITS